MTCSEDYKIVTIQGGCRENSLPGAWGCPPNPPLPLLWLKGYIKIMQTNIQQARSFVESRLGKTPPKVAIVLGSGLGSLAEELTGTTSVPYASIPGFAASNVVGHAGRLVAGKLDGKELIAMQGRVHFYEGHDMDLVTFPVRVLRALGVETLILTNAAGGLNPSYRPGDLMGIRDHIFLPGLAGMNPLRGPNDDEVGLRFPPLLKAYTPSLLELAGEEAKKLGIKFHQGIYIMVAGPSFETGAELRFLRQIGGDAVGMSTAPETVVAAHGGMQVLGISTITNTATGEGDAEANHEEVLQVGKEAGPRLSKLVKAILAKI